MCHTAYTVVLVCISKCAFPRLLIEQTKFRNFNFHQSDLSNQNVEKLYLVQWFFEVKHFVCVRARAPMNEYACWNRWNNNRHIQYRHRFILNVLLTRLAFPSISSSYVGDSVVSVRATKHRESCYRREENRRFIIYWTQINENWRLNIVMPFFSDLWL